MVEVLKTDQDRDAEVLVAELEDHVHEVKTLFDRGWPAQELIYVFESNEVAGGIPIELAHLLKTTLQFCADYDVDIVQALDLVA